MIIVGSNTIINHNSTAAAGSLPGDGVGYVRFAFPGILTLSVIIASGNSGALNYVMKAQGSFYRVLVSPVSPASVVAGFALHAAAVSFIDAVLLSVAGAFLSVQIASGIAGICAAALLIFAVSFCVACLSYALSMYLPNEESFNMAVTVFILPVFFLSPALFPAESFSPVIAAVVRWNPFSAVMETLRSLMISPQVSWGAVLFSTLLFSLLAVPLFFWALRSLNRERKL